MASQFCVCNSHKLCKLAQGKLAIGQGKHRESESKMGRGGAQCRTSKFRKGSVTLRN